MNIHTTNTRPVLEGSGCIMVNTGEPTNTPKYFILENEGDLWLEVGSYEEASAEFGRRLIERKGIKPVHIGAYPFVQAHHNGVPVSSLKIWNEHYR